MVCVILITYFLVSLISNANLSVQKENPLAGKYLRVIPMEYPLSMLIKRNSTGHVVQYDGVLAKHIAVLAQMFNFSYSFLPVNVTLLEDLPWARGSMYYLINDKADYVLSTSVATLSRFQYIDYPTSWHDGPFGCIVPYPKEKLNIQASLKPFSYQVWILVVISTIVTVVYLWVSNRNEFKRPLENIKIIDGTKKIVSFVLGNLVSQGQSFNSNRFAFRIAAGAWCGGCFFLVQMYCSTLTSHLTYPNQKPIVNSVQEIANTPGFSLTVDKGFGLDIVIQQTENMDLKRIATTLKINPDLRCNVTAYCLERVKGGFAAYGAPITPLKMIMGNDLKKTGICNYYLLKETFFYSGVFTALQKNSPYTETISIGILRQKQAGILNFWVAGYIPFYQKCLEINRDKKKIRRLSIGHLVSAFTILIAGYICATITLILEKLFDLFTNCQKLE